MRIVNFCRDCFVVKEGYSEGRESFDTEILFNYYYMEYEYNEWIIILGRGKCGCKVDCIGFYSVVVRWYGVEFNKNYTIGKGYEGSLVGMVELELYIGSFCFFFFVFKIVLFLLLLFIVRVVIMQIKSLYTESN